MKKILFLIFTVFMLTDISGQDYFNLRIPTEATNPNPVSLVVNGKHVFISVLSFIESLNSSTIVEFDLENNSSVDYNSVGFTIASKSLTPLEQGGYQAFGMNQGEPKVLSIKNFDDSFLQVSESTYKTIGELIGATTSISISEKTFGAAIEDYNNGEHREVHLLTINSLGEKLWSRNLGKQDRFTFGWDIDMSKDSQLILASSVVHNNLPGRFSQVSKYDTLGNLIWNFESTERTEIGGQWISQLSNNSIVLANRVNRKDSLDFILNDWYPFPPKLTWLNSDGDLIKDKVITSEYQNELIVTKILAGQGDYFFGVGQWADPISNEWFGWAFKISNEGDLLWSKRFQHPNAHNVNSTHSLRDLCELENGDLILVGSNVKVNEEQNLWLLKINSNGCFGTDECPDELVVSIQNEDFIYESLKVFPNPSSGKFSIETPTNIFISKVDIVNMEGNVIKTLDQLRYREVQIEDLVKGIYVLRVRLSNGTTSVKKIVVE